jgi:RNA polymerase subunit RPABC4/transcription elongation factor Spt4
MTRLLIISLLAAAAAAFIAERKGRDWISWAIGALIFPFAVLILIPLPALPKPGETRRCPKCSSIMGVGQDHCPNCGTETPIEMMECPGCGMFVTQGTKCPDCGKNL